MAVHFQYILLISSWSLGYRWNFGAAVIHTIAVQKHGATTGRLEAIRPGFFPYNIISHSCWGSAHILTSKYRELGIFHLTPILPQLVLYLPDMHSSLSFTWVSELNWKSQQVPDGKSPLLKLSMCKVKEDSNYCQLFPCSAPILFVWHW